jgi:hypothetical protein
MGTLLDRSVPESVSGQVSDNGVKETGWVCVGVEPGAVLPQAEKGFLRRVPRILSGAENAGRVPDQPRRFPVEELPECLRLAGRDPRRESGGRALTSRHGSWWFPVRPRERASAGVVPDGEPVVALAQASSNHAALFMLAVYTVAA